MRRHSFSFIILSFIVIVACAVRQPNTVKAQTPAVPSNIAQAITKSSSTTYSSSSTNSARASTRNAIPSPRSVLGFKPGDDRTIANWHQINDYFSRLDKASDRVHVETLGETTLHHPLIAAFISAPENIRELARYKEIQRRLADPRTVKDDTERDRLLRDGKIVVAISCSIHSNEIVASQMSMQLAYELATAEDADTREILQHTILVLIPSANPDGVDIVADWYRKTLGTPYEGTDPPVLYHHYAGHDDNRDWFMLNLRETKLLTRLLWKEWFPEIVYDVHQQGPNGSRFFVPPFYDPPNPNIAPVLLRQVALLGHKIAADLQSANFQGVITNALYDTWWHGGFRTAPYYHNSIGILTEAASAKLMTPANVTREQLARATTRGMSSALQNATNFPDPWPGGTWHPSDIMALELSASRSILSMAAKYRASYLRDFYELGRRNANAPIVNGQFFAYLISPGQGNDEAMVKLVSALVEQGVEVWRLDRELHGQFVINHPEGVESQRTEIMAEAPAGSYIVFLAQPYGANVRTLFERQTYPDRRTAGGEAERPYDVAGWTLPMQMGIETPLVLEIKEPASERRLTLVRDGEQVRRDLGLTASASPAEKKLLSALAARQASAQLIKRTDSPIANPLKHAVRLALYKSWTASWTASMDEGWTRYVFDNFNVPYQSLSDANVRAGNLRSRYDVIVLPSMRTKEIVEGNAAGDYQPEFTGGITDAGVDNLRRFVEEGGTLICFDASSDLAIKRFNLPLRNVLEGVKSSEFYCPGSILRINLDTAHPLSQTLPPNMDAYFTNSSAFEVTDSQRVRVVARYAEKDVLRSGWLLGENLIAGKVALAEVTLGKGRVVLFAFRPQHRAQTWGTFPLIFNAIESGAQ